MTDPQGNIHVEGTTPAIPTENKPAESSDPKLPDGVSERTKEEFDKLKAHNAQLKEELDVYKTKNSVLDDLKPSVVTPVETPNLTPTQVQEVKSRFIDESGYVDVARLETALREADERAKRAEAKVQQIETKIQGFEESAEVKTAHTEFPELDPKNAQFDAKFYELVRLELIGQMMNGKKDLVEAAKKVKSLYAPKVDVSQAKEEAVREYKTKVTKRDQASVTSSERGVTEPTNLEELRKRTLKGDDDALYKRLQASGN